MNVIRTMIVVSVSFATTTVERDAKTVRQLAYRSPELLSSLDDLCLNRSSLDLWHPYGPHTLWYR